MKCRTYKCKARCCYNVPFEGDHFERYSDFIVNPILDTVQVGNARVAWTTEGDYKKNKCPFLKADYTCNIYAHRPGICRKFGEINELPCAIRKK